MERSSGILLPVSALPSEGGIGTLGRAAFEFADFLAAAGQRYWQILPLGPTSYGDSPYQSFSVYAGSPYFVDPGLLMEDGLLTREERDAHTPHGDPGHVDYARIYETRFALLFCGAGGGMPRIFLASARKTRRGCRITRCSWRSNGILVCARGASGKMRTSA